MSRQDENEIQFVILLKQDDTIIIHSRASLSHTRDKFWPILWAEIGKVIKMSDENFTILNQEKIRDPFSVVRLKTQNYRSLKFSFSVLTLS